MKCIAIRIVEQNKQRTAFRITLQTDRGASFGRKSIGFWEGWAFIAANGVRMFSVHSPHINEDKMFEEIEFWVRGSAHEEDSKFLNVSTKGFKLIAEAIAEYNEHFKD